MILRNKPPEFYFLEKTYSHLISMLLECGVSIVLKALLSLRCQ